STTTLLSHFFVSVSGAHRALPSFPTRRSSDLGKGSALAGRCTARTRGATAAPFPETAPTHESGRFTGPGLARHSRGALGSRPSCKVRQPCGGNLVRGQPQEHPRPAFSRTFRRFGLPGRPAASSDSRGAWLR